MKYFKTDYLTKSGFPNLYISDIDPINQNNLIGISEEEYQIIKKEIFDYYEKNQNF